MKKSCLLKESKSVKCNKGSFLLNESKDSLPKPSSKHSNRFHADKKLKEGGKKNDQSSSLEEEEEKDYKNSDASTNVDKSLRSSPRLAKSTPWNPAKWVDNSFDDQKKDDLSLKDKCDKHDAEFSSKILRKKINESVGKHDAKTELQESTLSNSGNKAIDLEFDFDVKDTNDVSKSNSILTSGRKAQFDKNQVVQNSAKNDKNNSLGSSSPNFVVGKKRITSCDKSSTDTPKKIKMEESVNNENSNNNETSGASGDCNLLRLELDLENRKKDSVVVMRDIETIVSECESRNLKWKETYSKYDIPTRWGTPLVRQSVEKWDGNYIPAKLLERYQKFLHSKNMTHPIFLPPGSQVRFVLNSDATSELSSDVNLDSKSDGENGGREIDEMLQGQEDCPDSRVSVTDNSGRMVLRNRNQYRPVVIEDEDLSDDSDEWSNKQKFNKNKGMYRAPKMNSKSKKGSPLNNQQLISSMERCNINRKNGFKGDGLLGNNSSLEDETDSKAMAFVETMVCPICSLRFPKQHIESHATECASKTYKD